MTNLKFRILLTVGLVLGVLPISALSAEWLLVGRQGECLPLSSLARKGPEFRGLQTPYQLIEKMRAAGHQVKVKRDTQGSHGGSSCAYQRDRRYGRRGAGL